MSEPLRLHPKVTSGLALWCAVVFLGGAIFFGFHAVHLAQIGAREQEITARISGPGRWDHGPVYKYEFTLPDRREFDGVSRTPADERFTLGQSVTVYYDPKNPQANSLISFAKAQPNYLLMWVFLCGSAVSAICGVIMWRRAPTSSVA